jgi:hypothetical protein
VERKVMKGICVVAAVLITVMGAGCLTSDAPEGRYFLEEPGEGYIYIDLNSDGTFVISAEELEGDCFFDGVWKQTGNRIEFIDKSGRSSEYWDYCDCIFTKNTLSCEEAGWFTNRDDLPEQWIKQGAVALEDKPKIEPEPAEDNKRTGIKGGYTGKYISSEDSNYYIEIRPDGTVILSDGSTVLDTGTWQRTANKISFTIEDGQKVEATFSENGNVLTTAYGEKWVK